MRAHRKNLKLYWLGRDYRNATGMRSALAVLAEPGSNEETMKVFDLLVSIPKVGRAKAARLLARDHISPSKTLAGLSERQRSVLIKALSYYMRVHDAPEMARSRT